MSLEVPGLSSVAATYLPKATDATATSAAVTLTAPTAASNNNSALSSFAAQISKLSGLKETDPESFVTAVNEVADQLDAAGQEQGGNQGKTLSDLARRFRAAGKTGDLTSVQTPTAPPANFGGAGRGVSAYRQQQQRAQADDLGDVVNSIVSNATS